MVAYCNSKWAIMQVHYGKSELDVQMLACVLIEIKEVTKST